MAAAAQGLRTLDIPLFAATPLVPQPFPHIIVPCFVKADALDAVNADYPKIDNHRIFTSSEVANGHAYARILHAHHGPDITTAFADNYAKKGSAKPQKQLSQC